MGELKSIRDHKIKQKISDRELPYARCSECGCYVFNCYRMFREREDGKLLPEEHQVCANPRCQKKFEVKYDGLTYGM